VWDGILQITPNNTIHLGPSHSGDVRPYEGTPVTAIVAEIRTYLTTGK
jgi:hypothetical protein